MRKKFLLMTFLTLLFTAMGTSVLKAQGNVAKVGDTEYGTIDEAIANWTNNTTLTLLADVTLSDVVTINSTEHHILNLSTYTMTAASGKNAFVIKACGNGSAERSTITINADANNPGGINAGSKCVIYYKYADGGISAEDRPIIKINGGVFTGSTSSWGTAGIYTIGTAARKCATVNVAGGTFDCSIVGSGKSKLIVSGGLFNYTVSSQGDSTALRLISGGTFKTIGFMTADSNNTKFWIGTSMGNSNVGVCVDDNGYIVVGGPVVTEAGESFEASSANYSGASSYLQYSSAEDNGLYYTSVEEAFADNNNANGSVTVYVNELDMTGISYKGTIVVPKGSTITITNAPADLNVVDKDGNAITPNENGTYTTVTPQGNDFTGYTRTDAIWGEVWGNAYDSFVIKVLDANDNVMGTTSLNNVDGVINGNVNVTWSLKLDAASNTDQYWTMSWTTAPTIDNMPAKVELWVDGVKVSGGDVVLNAPDNLSPIYAAVTDADGKILSYHTSIAAAVAAITNTRSNPQGYIALLRNTDETVTLPAGITLNLNGFKAPNVSVPVAQIGDQTFTTLEAAFEAATEGQTITLLADATPALTSQRAITKAAVIDLGGKTLTLKEDDLYFGTTKFKNGNIIVDPSVKPSTAVFWMFANQTLTFDNVKLTATGVTGTYLIGLDGNNSDLNILNGSEIIVNNATALDLDIICVNASTGNDIVVDDSKVNIKNLDGRVFFRGNYTIKGNSDIDLDGITKAGFRIEAGQTLSIEDNATVDITGEPRDGGIHLTDLTATYTVAETATVNATVNQPVAVAQIGETKYATLAAAVAAVQEGQTIQLLAGEISEGTIKLPATLKNVTFIGAANHASVLKDMTIMAADGNSFNYEGLTFDGIYFNNSRISLTGWRNGDEIIKDLTVTNCWFKNLDDTSNSAPLHINKEASEPVNGLTFTNNVIDGATGGSKSGVYAQTTGVVVFTGNIINNVSFRPYVIQLTTDDGVADTFTVTDNTFSGSAAGRAQGLGNNAEGTDAVSLTISNNIFKDITEAQQICYWNFNEAKTTAVLEKNYYDIDIEENPDRIYFNSAAQDAYDLLDMGIFPIYTELNADGTINTESEYTPNIPFAQIGETGYPSLEAAAAAAQAGDEILLLANVTLSEELTTPAGITLNGNGKQINGTIKAGGDLTIKGHTKATSFNAGYNQPNITIGAGACLEITGTGRMVIGHGATFSITGTITDAKNANVADLTPSLIMPGASFTGAGVTFNVTDAYIKATAYCSSKNKNANGTFDFNIENSIWDQTGNLQFSEPTEGMDPTVNFELKNSVLTTTQHLIFGVTKGEVVFDNSNVNVGTSRQIENQSTMTVKNGSVVNGAVATSSNAKNPGTLIVDNATYAVTGEFSGSNLGTGTLIVNKTANFSAGSITKADIQIDATGMIVGDVVNITATLTNLVGTIEVINNNMLDAKIVDGKIVIVARTLQGEGTADNPYLINDISDLEFFRDAVNAGNTYAGKYIKLTDDIDLAPTRSGSNWTPIGTNGNPFNGTFDGQDHTISNLTITGYNSNVGFFGRTNNGEIKNVIFENAKVSGRLNVGVVAGTPYTSKYTNIKVKGHVEVNGMAYVGGVGGKDAYANWTDITVDVDETSYVKANSVENGTAYRTYVGGVVGFNGEGGHTFKNITSNIKVIGSTCDIGGIFGIAHYNNNFENIEHSGSVINETNDATEALETGLIAGVWHNAKGTSVTFTNTASSGTISAPNAGVTFPENSLVGAAYTPSNETSGTSGSLVINGETVYPYVAKIGEVGYNTLAKAITAAQSNDVVTLLWQEGEAPIAMNASLYGKNVTITGTATVDWSEDWLFVGRGGAGDATLTFENANLTSASNDVNSGLGIHVSGREKNSNNKYEGTLVINNSTIDLDYLINRGTIELDGGNLTVKNGFGIAGRPGTETESGDDATATITLNNNSKVVVNNHNGMGLGIAATQLEGFGIMNINSGSTFETTQSFTVTAKGTMNVNGGNVKVDGELTNNGAVNVTGESILDIETLTENEIYFLDGAIIKNSTVGGEVFVAGKVIFRGNNTFAMLYDFGTLTGYYGTTANMEWTVEKGASLTLTKMARYGLGYGDNVTINGSITNALEARENLTEYDRSLFMHGLVAQESSGFNCNSKLTVNNAYVVLGSNNSFGNKSGNYGGNYTFNFNNSVVDGSRITFYEALSSTEFTFEDSDVKIGTFMTRDTDSKFTLKNSKVLSTATSNGTDEGNYNAGELTLDKSSLTYSAEFANTGTLNIGENSTFTAQSVVNNGAINFTALSAKLDTDTKGLTIVDQVNNPDYKVVYKEGAYQFVQKVYVAQVDNGDKFETLQEAVDAVEDGGTITLIANETFTENNRYNNGGWWDGLGYSGDKSFTIDLATFTISQNGALNDYLMWFKNDGAKDNTITLKNGTLNAGTTAYCALATASSNAKKITINTENINIINNNSNGSTIKVRGGAELNVKDGTVITGTDSYLGIECSASTVNIYDGAKIYMNGTSSYNGCLVGACYDGTVNVYGGYGKGVKGGFIAMTSGGTINVAGGEWIANTDGTVGNNSNVYVLTAQNNKYEYGYAGASIINVTGGTFRGGMDAWILNNDPVEKAELNISGGNFNADPSTYVVAKYKAVQKADGTYDVIQIAGTQTFNMEDAGWYWFSTYIKFDTEGEGLDALKYELDDDASLIKGQYAFTNYLTYNNTSFWTSGNNALTTLSPSQMYMINTTSDDVEVDLTGAFLDYEAVPVTINVVEGWNWIGYPVSEEVDINNAIPNAEQGDVIKSQFDGYAMYYKDYPFNNTTLTGWYGELTTLKPGRGYMYQASEDGEFSYTKGNGNGAKSNIIDYNGKNYWFADATQYPNNMSIVAMLSIDGEIVKGNYEVAAFANGECRGSARPIYIEAIDTYVLYMTIYGDEVEELTFMYYDIDTDTEYELNNVMNYSNDAIVGTLSDPYIFSMNILGIGENSIDNINIYPNPTTTDREINLQATCDKVEVFNALGVKVAEYHNVDTLDALETAGIYVIRITNDNAVKHCRLVVK